MPQPRSNDPLRRAIRKLVQGLDQRESVRSEKRRYTRYPFEVPVDLCTKTIEGAYQTVCVAWASDLSLGGISCLAEQPLEADCTIYVNFEKLMGSTCCIPIKVRCNRTLVGNIHQINGQFIFQDEPGPDTGEDSEAAEAA